MANWKSVVINKNQVQANTGKSLLIACPHKSDYDGYSYWHPVKCVWKGSNSALLKVSFTDEFEFKLLQYGKGMYNKKEVLHEINLTPEEFEMIYSIPSDDMDMEGGDVE